MTTELQDNKRIAKNTVVLCVRMLITMSISVYMSRVLLMNLGVTDFGVNNVVGGVVGFFGFLNASLTNATQRFLNYEMGRHNEDSLNEVFSTSLHIHAIVALIFFVLGETVGLYLVNNTLDIPSERMFAANCVLQFTIFSAIINMVSVPYNALIISYERMSVFAIVAVVQSVVTLVICLSLEYMCFDRLIAYSAMLCFLHICIRIFYSIYCSRYLPSVRYFYHLGWSRMREMFFFAGWTMTGAFVYVTYTNGVSLLLNVFFGPMVNAAQGLSNLVTASLSTFATNIMIATKPQITKSYAEENLQRMKSLVYMSSKFCFIVMLTVSLPFFIRASYVLDLWLTVVPDHTKTFLRFALIISTWQALASPGTTAIQSTGRVRNFQLIVMIPLLSVLPLTYIVLYFGAPAEGAYIIIFVMQVVTQAVRVAFMRLQLSFGIISYCIMVVRLFAFAVMCSAVLWLLSYTISFTFVGFIILCFASLIICSACGLFIALDDHERSWVLCALRSGVRRLRR